jgi:hypothetical protein
MTTTIINLDARTFNKSVKKFIKANYPKVTGLRKHGKMIALLNDDKKVVGNWEATLMTGSKLVINSWY